MTKTHDAKKELDKLTAAQILAIPEDEPELLFTGDKAVLNTEFRTLSKLWHPDLNKDGEAENVFAHINRLRDRGEKNLKSGTWVTPGELNLRSLDGHEYRLKYLKKHAFELGSFYISENIVAYVIDKRLGGDLAINGLHAVQSLHYKDDKMRKEFQPRMPAVVKSFETTDSIVCVLKKDPDMVLLSDLRDYVMESTGSRLDSKHVAWVMSRLHSFACFLKVNGLTHNAITPDTVFVSPEMHTASFLGGWWYAAKEGAPLKGLPGAAVDVVPHDVLASGEATSRVDLELIRATGRDLLGDRTGSLILRDNSIPNAMAHWLTGATSGDAFKDFQGWSEDVLKSSFGPRRFTVLPVSFSDIYQPK